MFLKPFTDVLALVDCNNFFVSCERVFRPDLKHKPVAVLSNNDGCFIARSQEVKDLGIPMGAPYFKYKDVVSKNNITCFSANFTLYGEISRRIMSALSAFSPSVQVYSIDEAFLDLSHIPTRDLSDYISFIAKHIYKSIGIPISIGLAPTKTLAKLMSEQAKKHKVPTKNYYDIPPAELEEIYKKTPTQEVWGVGGKKSNKLKSFNIYTIYDLLKSNQSFIRTKFSIITERTYLELKGISCMQVSDVLVKKKNILSSRSFGTPVTDIASLEESVSSYIETASRKLRDQKCQTKYLSVFIKTSKYQPAYPNLAYRSFSKGTMLPYPTSSSSTLVKVAKSLLRELYQPGIRYKKSGVFLSHLQENLATQTSLIYNTDQEDKVSQLFQQIDSINRLYGKSTIQLASSGLKSSQWKMKRNKVSPDYLSDWKQIPKVN
jgi:DNA polymerase V